MVQGKKRKSRLHQPIMPDLLLKLREVWLGPTAGQDGQMLWVAATLCFFRFLTSGKITIPTDTAFEDTSHFTFKDIAVDRLNSPSMLRVRIKASKTDPFRVGVDVVLGKSVVPYAQSLQSWII